MADRTINSIDRGVREGYSIRAMKKILFALCFACLGLFALGAADWAKLVKDYGSGIAKIEIMMGKDVYSSGSGFVVDRKGKLITNAHVVSMAKDNPDLSIKVTFPQSKTPELAYTAQIAMLAEQVDLAILDLKQNLPVALPIRSGDEVDLMSDVLVMGFPLGKNFKATPGLIQAFQDFDGIGQMLDLSAGVDPGNSGGPVLGADGTVIGVVTAKIVGHNFNLALPLATLNGFLDAARNPVKLSITSEPAGARIFANGLYIGLSPQAFVLQGRKVELQVEADGFEPEKRVFIAGKESSPAEHFALKKPESTLVRLSIEVLQPGAKVYVDNRELGTAPLVHEAEPGSKVRIRVKLPGFKGLYLEKRLGTDREQTIKVDLSKGTWK